MEGDTLTHHTEPIGGLGSESIDTLQDWRHVNGTELVTQSHSLPSTSDSRLTRALGVLTRTRPMTDPSEKAGWRFKLRERIKPVRLRLYLTPDDARQFESRLRKLGFRRERGLTQNPELLPDNLVTFHIERGAFHKAMEKDRVMRAYLAKSV